jgi:hypothetical protein
MHRKERFAWAAACLAASAIGGASVNLFWRTPLAFADGDHDKTVKADRFELLDSDGKVRGVWACSKDDGSPVMVFLGPKGEARVTIATMGTESGLTIADKAGKSRVALAYEETGSGDLVFKDRKERARCAIVVEKDGTGGLTYFDENGKTVDKPSKPGDDDDDK